MLETLRPVERCRLCGAGRGAFEIALASVPDLEHPPESYRIVRCGACSLALTDPEPTLEALEALYAGGTSSDYEYPETGAFGKLKERLAAAAVASIARRAKVKPKTVLDFGTGAGRYAAMSARVFPKADVTGCDFARHHPAGSYYDAAPAITYTPYEGLEPQRRFDLILARHVIEHVHEPVSVVRDLLGRLSPGGALYIEVPNFTSATGRMVGASWPLFYVPKHLSHFTRRTLRQTIAEAGGTSTIGSCEMPMMSNVLALRFGCERDDPRFRIPGVAFHPVQLALEFLTRQGSCLWAIARPETPEA